MNETLQKALELAKEGVSALSDVFKSVAPEVWRIYVKQVYAEATAEAFAAVVLGGLAVYLSRKLWKCGMDSDEDGICALAVFIGAILGGIAFVCSIGAILGFVNPEYYAIQTLLEAFKGTTGH